MMISKGKIKKYYIMYTMCFLLIGIFVFSWYLFSGRTFIWQYDGWQQHFRALVYYAKYMRNIIRGIIGQELTIPNWDFALGEGNDIISTLHYYVIGDPFAVFSVFIPTRYMHIYYDFMIVLRLYLSGMAFAWLCFYNGKNNSYAVLAGTITYVFNYWTMLNVARHPYFLNPMLYLPLLILGVEKILRKDRPYLFVVAVMISALSNFYFFYVLVIITIIYVVVRLCVEYRKNFKKTLNSIFQIGIWAILGVCLAAIILVPILNTIFSDARMNVQNAQHWIYPLSHYSKLLAMFVASTDSYWACMGYSIPTLIAVFLMFRKKETNEILKYLFVIGVIILCVPFLGQMFNGFSYISNRWIFGFALLASYILTVMWPEMMKLSINEYISIIFFLCAYSIMCLLLEYSRITNVFVSLGLGFVFIILCCCPQGETEKILCIGRQKIALIILAVSIINNSFWLNADGGADYAAQSKEKGQIEQLHMNETLAVKNVATADAVKEFYRYSGRGLTPNANMLAGISSSQYYWTISNPNAVEFRSNMGILSMAHDYSGYDERSTLLALNSVRYYVIPEEYNDPVPYGFTYVTTINVKESVTAEAIGTLKQELEMENITEDQIAVIDKATQSRYRIYRNDYVLPLTYSYDNYMSKEIWDDMSTVKKQEVLLEAAVLEEDLKLISEEELNLVSQILPHTIVCNDSGVLLKGNQFIVTSSNSKATIYFDGVENSETYISIKNLRFEGTTQYDLYHGDESIDPLNLYNKTNWNLLTFSQQEAIRKSRLFWTEPQSVKVSMQTSSGLIKNLTYYTPEYSFYANQHDFTVNLSYSESNITSLTITFPTIGKYSFDDISIVCQPMSSFETKVAALAENSVKNLNVGIDYVSGTASFNEPELVCFAIPYSVGWSAYVDGNEVPLHKVNVMHMGVEVEKGEHKIDLVYETPLLKEGMFISGLGIIIFVGVILKEEYKRKKQ